METASLDVLYFFLFLIFDIFSIITIPEERTKQTKKQHTTNRQGKQEEGGDPPLLRSIPVYPNSPSAMSYQVLLFTAVVTSSCVQNAVEALAAVGTRRALHEDVFPVKEDVDGHEPGHKDPPNENENDPEASSWMSDAAQHEQEEEGLSLVSYVVLAVVVNITVCGVCFVLGWYQDRQIMQRSKLGRLLWHHSQPHVTPPAVEAEASTVATNEDDDDHFDSQDRVPRYFVPIIITTIPPPLIHPDHHHPVQHPDHHHAKGRETYDAEAPLHQDFCRNEAQKDDDSPRMTPSQAQGPQQQQPERCKDE